MDDADRYLTRVVGLQYDRAIAELQDKLLRGDLRLHWRRTDPAGFGQAGDMPAAAWRSQLCVARDRNADMQHGPIDFATGKITARNDGHAFVQLLQAQDPGHTYDLTLSMRDVRMLWPTQLRAEISERTEAAPEQKPISPPPTNYKTTPTNPEHEMIRAILARTFPENGPRYDDIAPKHQLKAVRDGWNAECKARKMTHLEGHPPDRNKIRRALKPH